MSKRPVRLGELLVELGRITPDDVERALAHQREHGGYVGDALIQLGALTREELRWSLASQHSIPFVHLRPENIDSALAAHVPAAWAREHLMLPVLRAGDAVTVVLADPSDIEKLEEVQRLTGAAAAEPALASPDGILELIEAVYGAAPGPETGVLRMISEALAAGAGTLGISVRQGRAVGWYRVTEVVSRALRSGWETDLAEVVHPLVPLSGSAEGRPRSWPAMLRDPAGDRVIACSTLGSGRRLEWAARMVRLTSVDVSRARVDPLTLALATRAIEDGSLLARVRADRGRGGHEEEVEAAVALLPNLLLRRETRSIHLSDRPVAMPAGVLTVRCGGGLAQELAAVAPFELEAVTVAVDRLPPAAAEALRGAAPVVVVLVRGSRPAPIDGALDLYLREVEGLRWTHHAGDDGTD